MRTRRTPGRASRNFALTRTKPSARGERRNKGAPTMHRAIIAVGQMTPRSGHDHGSALIRSYCSLPCRRSRCYARALRPAGGALNKASDFCEPSCSEEVAMNQTIAVERVDHIGIRVRDLDRALNFYRVLGFALQHQAQGDTVAIIRNENAVELNLIFNADAGEPNTNVLMDAPDKYPGYTHMALRVPSIPATIAALKANDIAITQGPVSFDDSGQV